MTKQRSIGGEERGGAEESECRMERFKQKWSMSLLPREDHDRGWSSFETHPCEYHTDTDCQ